MPGTPYGSTEDLQMIICMSIVIWTNAENIWATFAIV